MQPETNPDQAMALILSKRVSSMMFPFGIQSEVSFINESIKKVTYFYLHLCACVYVYCMCVIASGEGVGSCGYGAIGICEPLDMGVRN